ncbi:hypothetical protein POSPLADRAFT_1040217 [Postia placenta MAD-698-R-SB12]|uniref:Uncharacterized protein n=1 Tax=Postia placenta MAD-698-R-SB12 TaxID=670580 RepID=A0A1X6MZS4_9APHY|nr:hypothetical protein POSPLADRAFT_1040217 [Postia placenta MAD-698-R-SB12]OSX61871.1 hypothetical protein POSPLADRAFT_1040217 [Postia placenta MAD-698-R-SB12]
MRDFIPLWTWNSCGTGRISMLCATAPLYRAEHFRPFFVLCRDYYGLHTQFESLTARSHSSISQGCELVRCGVVGPVCTRWVSYCTANYSGAILCTSRPQKTAQSCALLCQHP